MLWMMNCIIKEMQNCLDFHCLLTSLVIFDWMLDIVYKKIIESSGKTILLFSCGHL